MDSTTVERLERARIRFLLWEIVIYTVGIGALILFEFLRDGAGGTLLWGIAVAAAVAILLLGRRVAKYRKELERDKDVEAALNNEMYRSYEYKADALGYNVTLIAAVAAIVCLPHVVLPWQACVLSVCYVGMLAAKVRLFLYYKRG